MLRDRLRQSGVHRLKVMFAFVVALFFVASPSALAITSVSTGYSTSDKLSVGSIVSIDKNDSTRVVGSTSENVDNLLGVVIDADGSLLSISNGDENQVQVATSGTATVLVSDINGTVKVGDQITASPIKGVGMRATNNSKVIGVAQTEPRTGTEKQEIKDENGNSREVTLGQVKIVVSVSFFTQETKKTLIPSAIQNIANALANKEVEPLPIIISLAIFIITLIVVSSIIYSMIRSSIISVGRNPMSQSAIYRDVIHLSALVLGIIAVAFVAIFLILTKM